MDFSSTLLTGFLAASKLILGLGAVVAAVFALEEVAGRYFKSGFKPAW